MKLRVRTAVLTAVGCALIAFTADFADAAYLFHLTDLGILPGEVTSAAYGINSLGQVVGASNTSTQVSPFVTNLVTTTPNGLFTDPSSNRGNGIGLAINDNGQVTGYDNGANRHAVRLNPGQSISDAGTDLGTLGGSSSQGASINASGQVAGWALRSDRFQHAVRTTATGLISDPNTDLGAPQGGYSYATGINASGQTVGTTSAPVVGDRAFRTSPTGLVTSPGADLGEMPGRSESEALGINASGQTVGYSFSSTLNPPQRAFRTSATGDLTDPAADLGTLPGDTFSIAYAINDPGWVVGISGVLNGPFRAMLQDGSKMYDLGLLLDSSGTGWTLGLMNGINNSDQIVGSGVPPLGKYNHAVRLDLVSVPEPPSLALIVVGGTFLCAWIPNSRKKHGRQWS